MHLTGGQEDASWTCSLSPLSRAVTLLNCIASWEQAIAVLCRHTWTRPVEQDQANHNMHLGCVNPVFTPCVDLKRTWSQICNPLQSLWKTPNWWQLRRGLRIVQHSIKIKKSPVMLMMAQSFLSVYLVVKCPLQMRIIDLLYISFLLLCAFRCRLSNLGSRGRCPLCWWCRTSGSISWKWRQKPSEWSTFCKKKC